MCGYSIGTDVAVMLKYGLVVFFVLFGCFTVSISFVQADNGNSGKVQDVENNNNLDTGAKTEKTKGARARNVDAHANFSVEKIPPLFFTYWQYMAITDAKNSKGVVRAPTQSELNDFEGGDGAEVDMGLRDIVLGGIVFVSEDDWTIWLNGERVTPMAVPEEVLDLRVFEDYIEIKWLDEYTNQVFPIRMRSHQRFNLDSRIFLPG